MAVAYPSRQAVKLYVVQPDGMVYDIGGYMVSLEISTTIGHHNTVSLEIVDADVSMLLGKEIAANVKAQRSTAEWRCPFCGRPNQRADEVCKSCGGVRPFLYD